MDKLAINWKTFDKIRLQQPYSKSKLEMNSKKSNLSNANKFRLCLYLSFLHLKPDFRY